MACRLHARKVAISLADKVWAMTRKKRQTPLAHDSPGTQKPQSQNVSQSKRRGGQFGLEGTNKTSPVAPLDAQPSDELQGTKTKFVPKSPYTRG